MEDSMESVFDASFYRQIIDAIPSPIFVVDSDVRIVAFNRAASALLGGRAESAVLKRGGEALGCIHATEAPEGCGRSASCADCAVRSAVNRTSREGVVVRRPQRMQIENREGKKDVYLLVTTSMLSGGDSPMVVLVLQDIGALVSSEGLVPVCMHCQKVRDAANTWSGMDKYLKEHLDIDMSHGLCPECLKKHYPELREPDGA